MKIKLPVCPTCSTLCVGSPIGVIPGTKSQVMLWICGACLPPVRCEPTWVEIEAA